MVYPRAMYLSGWSRSLYRAGTQAWRPAPPGPRIQQGWKWLIESCI